MPLQGTLWSYPLSAEPCKRVHHRLASCVPVAMPPDDHAGPMHTHKRMHLLKNPHTYSKFCFIPRVPPRMPVSALGGPH